MKKAAIFFFVLMTHLVLGQARFQAYPDTTRVQLGEPFGVIAALQPGLEASWPALNLGDSFDFLSLDTLRWDEEAHILQLTVAAYDSGYLAFPPLVVVQGDDTLSSDPFPMYVGYPKADPNVELHDIHGPEWVPPVWLIWVLAGFKMVWTLLVLVLMVMNRQRPFTPDHFAPLHPWDEAVSLLRQMETKRFYETLAVKDYYTQLTDALRLFGEKHWNVPLREETTRNIQHLLEGTGLGNDQVLVFVEILEEADMAKFARKVPDVQTRKVHLERAMAWLNNQKPRNDV